MKYIDSDSDTIVTAGDSLFNSPSESLQDLNQMSSLTPYNPLLYNTSSSAGDSHKTISYHRRRNSGSDSNSSSSEGSSDTLVDAASMVSVSLASSCDTYISQGGDAYKCARNEFVYRRKLKKPKMLVAVDVPFKSRYVNTIKSLVRLFDFS